MAFDCSHTGSPGLVLILVMESIVRVLSCFVTQAVSLREHATNCALKKKPDRMAGL